MTNRFHSRGVTLIELVAFIVIISVVVAGLMTGISTTLRGSGTPKQMTQTLQLAQERMELILARKDAVGFACFTGTRYDPCQAAAAAGSCAVFLASTHPACNTTYGYTITPALDETGACMGGDINYKCITVTVTGSGSTWAALNAFVTSY